MSSALDDRLPGVRLTDLAYTDGTVRAEAVL
jgi:hypothetical protein